MYTLTTGLYKQFTEKEEYFVIILGLDNAGKTVRNCGFEKREFWEGIRNGTSFDIGEESF